MSSRFRAVVSAALAALLISHVATEAPGRATREPTQRLRYDEAALRSGDVIFRAGIGLTSRLVLSADGGSVYSHVGLLVGVDGKRWVVHVEPEQDPRVPAVVKMEPLDLFLAPDRASAAVAYRPSVVPESLVRKAVAAARTYVHDRVAFDPGLDLSSADRLYCTELVWRAFLAAGVDLVDGRFDYLSFPLAHGPYVLPSSLERSRWLGRIPTFTTKEGDP